MKFALPEIALSKLALSKLALSVAFLSALSALAFTSSASATVRLSDDTGGQIGTYMQKFAALRRSGEKVMIDGPCVSACTMVLGLVPRGRLCVTPQAQLGFHAAWDRDRNGTQVTSRPGTQLLMNVYPAPVRQWINKRGGLTPQMIYLSGSELLTMVPAC